MQHFFLTIGLVCLFSCVFAQNEKEELEKKRWAIQQKIEQTNKILAQTQVEQKRGLDQLYAVQQQIGQIENLNSAMAQEINLLEKEIQELEPRIANLENELKLYKDEYAAMVYMASKANNSLKKLSFLFAAESFNQLLARLNYFNQYSDARTKQIEHIEKTKRQLSTAKTDKQIKLTEKTSLLQNQQKQGESLKKWQNEKDGLVADWKQKETDLQQEYARQQTEAETLDKLIQETLAKVIEKQQVTVNTEIKTETISNPEANIEANKETTPNANTVVMKGSFSQSKGRLTWPVQVGFVSRKFGKYADPVDQRIELSNLGINIRTSTDADIYCVFEGKIAIIGQMPLQGEKFVLIQHQDYYTIYVNLKEINVKIGQQVSAKTILGKVELNENGIPEFQFQIWREIGDKKTEKLNPEEWLGK